MLIKVNGMITNDDDAPIYRDWFGMTVVSPSDIIGQLPNDGSDVSLEIASDGGEVDAATEVYTALHNYPGNVTAQIVSNAYSAGTIIAMGANKVQMSPGAKMMIHNASCGTQGDYHEMDTTSGMLKTTNQAIANMYSVKTGKPVNDFLALMDKETWLSAEDAIDLGLADEQIDYSPEPVTNTIGKLIPHKAIEKVKNLVAENKKIKQLNMSMGSGDSDDNLNPAINPLYPEGTEVTVLADHMSGMKGAKGVVDHAYNANVYMIDYTPTDGTPEVVDHRWVTEDELSSPDESNEKNSKKNNSRLQNLRQKKLAIFLDQK